MTPAPDSSAALRRDSLVRIVDDDAEIRSTLSLMLDVDGWRTAAYPSAETLLVEDSPSDPGCILLDIQMEGMTGIDLQLTLIERGVSLPIIFVTGHADVETAVDSMRRGAFDFLQKPVRPERLLDSIERACARSWGEHRTTLTAPEAAEACRSLTERQREIVRHLLKGETSRQIADRFGISLRTVQGHRLFIYRALGIHRAEQFFDLGPLLEDALAAID